MCPKGERVRERERWRLLHRRSIRSFIDVYIGTTETESCNVRANCGEGIKGDFLAWVGKKKHPSPLAITLLSHSIYSKFHDKKMTRTMTLTGKPIQTSRKRNDFSKNSYVK